MLYSFDNSVKLGHTLMCISIYVHMASMDSWRDGCTHILTKVKFELRDPHFDKE